MIPKKMLALLIALFTLGGLSNLGAEIKTSPFFVKNLMVSKVFLYQEGYRVSYYTNGFRLQNVYIPIEWFSLSAGYKTEDGNRKAELFYGEGAEYPYLQVYWKDGKFHHMVLRVRRDYSDPSWGATDPKVSAKEFFKPDAEPEFKF